MVRVTEGGAPETGDIQRQAQGKSGRGHSHRSLEVLSSDQGVFDVHVEQDSERCETISHKHGIRKVCLDLREILSNIRSFNFRL